MNKHIPELPSPTRTRFYTHSLKSFVVDRKQCKSQLTASLVLTAENCSEKTERNSQWTPPGPFLFFFLHPYICICMCMYICVFVCICIGSRYTNKHDGYQIFRHVVVSAALTLGTPLRTTATTTAIRHRSTSLPSSPQPPSFP